MGSGLPDAIAQNIQRQQRDLLIQGARLGRNFKRVRQREFWSSYLFTPGKGGVIDPGQYPLFTTIQGGTGQGYQAPLKLRETNWQQPAKISDQQNLVMKALHVGIQRGPSDLSVYDPAQLQAGVIDPTIPLHPSDVAAIASNVVLQVKYITEQIPMGLLRDFPEVGGVNGFYEASRAEPGAASPLSRTVSVTGAPLNQQVEAYPQLPIARNNVAAAFERRFKVPLMLSHGEQFQVILEVSPPGIQLMAAAAGEQTSEINRNTTGLVEIVVGFWCTESWVEQS